MTPESVSFCTRCRTAASLSPTALPISAYERRPSSCSCSMMAFDTESSWRGLAGAPRRWSITPRLCQREQSRASGSVVKGGSGDEIRGILCAGWWSRVVGCPILTEKERDEHELLRGGRRGHGDDRQ